ncbi:MAG: hypothetical protein Q7R33_02870 [Nitrosarchaeum sp.]|nr:hypothetical protein [Nitrosarchaeum sp.]
MKPEKREAFELGKGLWNNIFPSTIRQFKINTPGPFGLAYLRQDDLYIDILGKIAWTFNEGLTLSYFKRIAVDIFTWCGSDTLICSIDHWFEESGQAHACKITGSRYTKDTRRIEPEVANKEELYKLPASKFAMMS